MPARRTALRQLFSKGQVTDVDTADLAPDMAESLRDCVWTANGDLSKRGGFLYATGANPINGNTDLVAGVFLYPLKDTSTPDTFTYKLLVTDSVGRLGILSSYTYSYGTANTATTATFLTMPDGAFPVLLWQDEVVFASDNSFRTLFRWAGSTGTEDSSPTGTVAMTAGQDVVTGSGTVFTTEVAVGQYMNIEDGDGVFTAFLVEQVESNTRLRVSAPSQITYPGDTFTVTNFGRVNISTLVTDKGLVSGSTTTLTGLGTDWDTGLDQIDGGVFNNADWISASDSTQRIGISSATSDTSLNLRGTPSPAWSSDPYVVGRPLTGNIVTSHAGRLWVAGVPWAPNRLQVTPVGYNLSDVFNGVDSSSTDPDNAAIVESVDIPDPNSPGFITALASGNDPGPLLVLRDRDAYIAYGEWPSVQVTKLGDDIGCLDWRAVTFHDRTFYWAGLEGVFSYTPGGGVRNLTEGRIYREWKAAVSAASLTSTIVAVVNQTLFVAVDTLGGTDFAYTFDIERGAWSTLTDGRWAQATPVVFAEAARDVFVTELGTNRVVSLRAATDPAYAGTSNSLQGSFLARSGRMLMGSAGDLGRVVDSRVTYRMTAGSSPQFTVKYGSVSLNTAATVTTTTSGTAYATQRIKPGSTNLGTSARDMQVEFAESSGTPARLEINEFSWVTRERRKRA